MSGKADEVENVVLVPCRDQLVKQAILLARLSPHLLRLSREVAVRLTLPKDQILALGHGSLKIAC